MINYVYFSLNKSESMNKCLFQLYVKLLALMSHATTQHLVRRCRRLLGAQHWLLISMIYF